jgi:hypothetical protein
MGKVMGPYDISTWLTMGMLKRDIDYMKSKSETKYKLAIKAQKETYEHMKEVA